jgi:hypothetical protein
VAVDDLFGEGDRIVGRLTYRGTHTGDFQMWLAPVDPAPECAVFP